MAVTSHATPLYTGMRLLLLLVLECAFMTTNAQSTMLFDSISRTHFTYDSIWLEMTIQDENYVSTSRLVTGYHRNGAKSYQYRERRGLVYFDTLREWSESGLLEHIEISSDTGYVEIDFDPHSGVIIQRGENKIGKYSGTITIVDDTGELGFRSAWCDSGCIIPVGEWITFHDNGLIESEGEFLPFNMQKLQTYIDTIPADMLGNLNVHVLCIVESETKVRDGKWVFYNDQGVKIREEIYESGLLRSVVEFH